MDTKYEISARFLEVYDRLLTDGCITDKKDFAQKIGVSASMITEISKGRSSVGTTAIQNLVLSFGISSDWLLTGRGQMLLADGRPLEPEKPSVPANVKVEERLAEQGITADLIKDLLNRITEQAAEIGRLNEQNANLRRHLEKAVQDAQTVAVAAAG